MLRRFALEQQIMSCWNITDELRLVGDTVLEGTLSMEEVANILLGLSDLYQLKFEKCFDTFEKCVTDKEI